VRAGMDDAIADSAAAELVILVGLQARRSAGSAMDGTGGFEVTAMRTGTENDDAGPGS
jgi:hypothetical protein